MVPRGHGCCSCVLRDEELIGLHPAVRAWLEAHAARDVDREVTSLTEDVVVAADGRLFVGRAAACDWSRRAADPDPALRSVSCLVRGDATLVTLSFEGPAPVEVTYCFLLSGELIRGLAVAA